jgi:hypothetical protein
MNKPSDFILELYALGRVESIKVHCSVAMDTTSTSVEMGFVDEPSRTLPKETFSEYFDLHIGWDSVAELKEVYASAASDWDEYEEEHAEELAIYESLKAKFEPNKGDIDV